MACFPDQVDYGPVILSLLQMIEGEVGQFTTAQPTAK
jgi:hypothetical protein